MFFVVVLILSTLSIAGSAAFFSVYGLAQLFKGTFLSVIFMGSSLEAGKLVAVSFLYRYWNKVGWALKSYLFVAVLLLMVITSMGVYGFLSMGYQTDTLSLKNVSGQISLLRDEQKQLELRKQQIDEQISQLPTNMVKGRQKLMQTFNPELRVINKRLPEITKLMQALSTQEITTQAHVGPIIYIAKAFGKDVDDAASYIILLIIIVFDPLAVALTIGVNVALRVRKIEQEIDKPDEIPVDDDQHVILVDSETALDGNMVKKIVADEIRNLSDKLQSARTEVQRRDDIIKQLRKGSSSA